MMTMRQRIQRPACARKKQKPFYPDLIILLIIAGIASTVLFMSRPAYASSASPVQKTQSQSTARTAHSGAGCQNVQLITAPECLQGTQDQSIYQQNNAKF